MEDEMTFNPPPLIWCTACATGEAINSFIIRLLNPNCQTKCLRNLLDLFHISIWDRAQRKRFCQMIGPFFCLPEPKQANHISLLQVEPVGINLIHELDLV